jgi:hypothetical protein
VQRFGSSFVQFFFQSTIFRRHSQSSDQNSEMHRFPIEIF